MPWKLYEKYPNDKKSDGKWISWLAFGILLFSVIVHLIMEYYS